MAQLRKIEDTEGRIWSVLPDACVVVSYDGAGSAAEVIVGRGFGPQRIYVKDRERVEYILTMRDPRKHCDPVPDWMERPDCDGLSDVGAGIRREGVRRQDLGGWDSEREVAEGGWDAQQQIAIDFYDAHVVGHEGSQP